MPPHVIDPACRSRWQPTDMGLITIRVRSRSPAGFTRRGLARRLWRWRCISRLRSAIAAQTTRSRHPGTFLGTCRCDGGIRSATECFYPDPEGALATKPNITFLGLVTSSLRPSVYVSHAGHASSLYAAYDIVQARPPKPRAEARALGRLPLRHGQRSPFPHACDLIVGDRHEFDPVRSFANRTALAQHPPAWTSNLSRSQIVETCDGYGGTCCFPRGVLVPSTLNADVLTGIHHSLSSGRGLSQIKLSRDFKAIAGVFWDNALRGTMRL
jgi:hypothetical protein